MSWIDLLRRWVARASPASRFGIGRKYLNEKNYDQAERYLDPFLDVEAQEVGVSVAEFGSILFEIGRCAWETNRPERAVGIWQRVVAMASFLPDTGSALFSIAKAELIAGKIDQAIKTFDRSIKADQTQGRQVAAVQSMVWAAGYLADAGALLPALEFLNRALPILEMTLPEETASLDGCLFLLGFVQKQLGNSNQAVRMLGKRIDVLRRAKTVEVSRLARAYYDLAGQYEYDGKYDLCLTSLNDAELFSKQETPVGTQMIHAISTYRGVVAIHRKQYDQAVALFESSLINGRGSHNPDLWLSLNNLAYALIKSCKQLQQAEDLLAEALPLVPQDGSRSYFLNTLAALAQAKGEFDWAEAIYLTALHLSTSGRAKATGFAFLADLYVQLGREAEAGTAYEKALQAWDLSGPVDHPDRVEIEQRLRVSPPP